MFCVCVCVFEWALAPQDIVSCCISVAHFAAFQTPALDRYMNTLVSRCAHASTNARYPQIYQPRRQEGM